MNFVLQTSKRNALCCLLHSVISCFLVWSTITYGQRVGCTEQSNTVTPTCVASSEAEARRRTSSICCSSFVLTLLRWLTFSSSSWSWSSSSWQMRNSQKGISGQLFNVKHHEIWLPATIEPLTQSMRDLGPPQTRQVVYRRQLNRIDNC